MRPIFILLFCLLSAAHEVMAADISVIKAKAEVVISHCEELYSRVVNSREILVTKLSQSKDSRVRNKNYLNLITFDTEFSHFAKITNEKIKIRIAETIIELSRALEAYSSNCTRFGQGLLGFVRWTQGAGPEGFDKIYSEWVEQVSKNIDSSN